MREVEWWVEQAAALLSAEDAAALQRDLDQLAGDMAEAQGGALPAARVAVCDGDTYKS
eukprot:COSAG03_NODE_1342_length_4292_cov_3.123242_3_plen_58_part_00